MIYTTFAQLYDDLMDPSVYTDWENYLTHRVKKHNGKLLDLGCGSGILMEKLKGDGFAVEGLDLSEDMLTLASQRAQTAGDTWPLYQGNMLDLSGLGTYGTIISSLDSLCYLADANEVQTVFQEVYAHLQADGSFLFDVHSLYQMDEFFPDYMYNYQDKNEAFLWHSYATDKPHAIEHELTFFVKDSAKDYFLRLNEYHYERTYPLQEYKELLTKVGFTEIEVSADFGQSSVSTTSNRWFFWCQK